MNKPVEARRNGAQESVSDLLNRLGSSWAALIRDEIDLAKQEVREKLAAFRVALILIAAGATVGFAALLVLCAAVVAGLALLIGWPLSAVIVGIGLAFISGIIVLFGVRLLKRTTVKPEKTIQSLKEDKEWLKGMT
jgi:uncharacterized membrane protein YqjE